MAPSISVFIVEPSARLRATLRARLRRLHVASAGSAGSAESAIAGIGRCQPDLVLLDWRLANGSGVHVLRAAKWLWPHIRFAVLGGRDSSSERRRYREEGADYFCPLTSDYADLAAIVAAVANRRFRPDRSARGGGARAH